MDWAHVRLTSGRGARPPRAGLRGRRDGEPAAPASSVRWPTVIAPIGHERLGHAERLPEPVDLLARDAEEAGAEPLVDGGLQDQQRRPSRCRCASRAPASGAPPGRPSPCPARRSGRGRPPCWTAARSPPVPSASRSASRPAAASAGGGRRPEPLHVLGAVEHQERPALAEAGARRAHRVAQHPVHARPGRPARRRSRRIILRRRTTSWNSMETIMSPVTDFEQMWRDLAPVGRSASSGGYFRQPFTSAERECHAWFLEQCAARGLEVERDRFGNTVAWWRPDRGRVGTARCSPARTSTRSSTAVRTTDRSAWSSRWPPSTCSATAASPRPADRRRRLRRGGGLAVRPGLPGVPAGDRRDGLGHGARRSPTATASPLEDALAAADRGDADLLARRRRLRRAARRAGPRPRRPGRRRSAWPARSGRTAASASTSPARPTTPAPRGWRTGTTRC